MQLQLDQFKDYLIAQNKIFNIEDCESVCELLYRFYMETCVEETQVVRDRYAAIHSHISHLTLHQQDDIWDRICDICTEYERAAFLQGLHLGAKLMLELSQ